jgi:hypothetical protein
MRTPDIFNRQARNYGSCKLLLFQKYYVPTLARSVPALMYQLVLKIFCRCWCRYVRIEVFFMRIIAEYKPSYRHSGHGSFKSMSSLPRFSLFPGRKCTAAFDFLCLASSGMV